MNQNQPETAYSEEHPDNEQDLTEEEIQAILDAPPPRDEEDVDAE